VFDIAGGRFARAVVAFFAVLLWGVEPIWAASQTWNGNGANGNWSTIGTWVTGAAPGSTLVKNNTDTATFNGTGSATNLTVAIDSTTQDIGSTSFDTTAAKAYIIGGFGANGGNSLFLSSGGTILITATETNAITETINAPLLLEGNYTFADNSTNAGSSLIFGGNY
jgi:hypothetical protein